MCVVFHFLYVFTKDEIVIFILVYLWWLMIIFYIEQDAFDKRMSINIKAIFWFH